MSRTLIRSHRGTGRSSRQPRRDDVLDQLSPRELEVLALMAAGRSNLAIGEQLAVELKTVETHVGRVFTKLGLDEDRNENRRVLAVLTFFGRHSAVPREEVPGLRTQDARKGREDASERRVRAPHKRLDAS